MFNISSILDLTIDENSYPHKSDTIQESPTEGLENLIDHNFDFINKG